MLAGLRTPRFWIGIAISVVALGLALRGVKWSNVQAELVGADYAWLVPAAAVIVVGQVARSVRWRAMFTADIRPALAPLFAILSVGYFVSNLLPLRAGDFVRAWLVGVYTPAGATEALATVMLERVVDFLTILGLVALIVPVPAALLMGRVFGPGPWADPTIVRVVSLLAVLGLYLVLVALAVLAGPVERSVDRILGRLGMRTALATRIGDLVGRFLGAMGALRRPRTALVVGGWSIVVWLLGGLQYWLVMRAFHMDLPYAAAIFALGATALFAVLPSSPGYVGVFHQAIRVSLPVVAPRVTPDEALSYAVVLHGLSVVMLIILGVVGLLMLGLSLPDLMRRMGTNRATV